MVEFSLCLSQTRLSCIRYEKVSNDHIKTKAKLGNSVNLSKVSCMRKIWHSLVPGKSKINLFSISFFYTHGLRSSLRAVVTHSSQHTTQNLHRGQLCGFNVLCDWAVYLHTADHSTTWSSVLGAEFAARRTWPGIRRSGEVMSGADKSTE